MDNRSSNMQGMPKKYTDGLLRCLLKGLRVTRLIHLLSSPVVDSCQLSSTMSCECMWAKWVPRLSHLEPQSYLRSESKLPLDVNHWLWSESKLNHNSTQSMAEIKGEAEKKGGKTTNICLLHCSSPLMPYIKSTHSEPSGREAAIISAKDFIYKTSWNKL